MVRTIALSTLHYCLSTSSVGQMGDGWISSPLVQERFRAAWFMFIVRATVGRATLATDRPLEPHECFPASDETFETSYESREKNSWCTVLEVSARSTLQSPGKGINFPRGKFRVYHRKTNQTTKRAYLNKVVRLSTMSNSFKPNQTNTFTFWKQTWKSQIQN